MQPLSPTILRPGVQSALVADNLVVLVSIGFPFVTEVFLLLLANSSPVGNAGGI